MKTVGIIGGGQLGMMLAQAAKKLNFNVIVLDPTPNAPASAVADEQIIGGFNDEKKIRELAAKSDFLTFEIELAGSEILEELMKEGIPVHPSPHTLSIIKDKFIQKIFLQQHGIPTADFLDIKNADDVKRAGELLGYPFILKAKRGSYDGRGNLTIEKASIILESLEKFKGQEVYAEKFFSFNKELAIMACRGKGGTALFPVVETIHKNHICHTVLVPADVPPEIIARVKEIAQKTLEIFDGQGVFGIELFYKEPNMVLVNEISPRVHNSGHYTIEACITSQFEQHIRAVTNIPLGDTSLVTPCAVMVNILGERNGTTTPRGIEEASAVQGTGIHLYGKLEVREGRKMGHITSIGESLKEAQGRAEKARSLVSL